jgi:hypothetical protein
MKYLNLCVRNILGDTMNIQCPDNITVYDLKKRWSDKYLYDRKLYKFYFIYKERTIKNHEVVGNIFNEDNNLYVLFRLPERLEKYKRKLLYLMTLKKTSISIDDK